MKQIYQNDAKMELEIIEISIGLRKGDGRHLPVFYHGRRKHVDNKWYQNPRQISKQQPSNKFQNGILKNMKN